MVFFGNIFTSMAAGVTFNLELYALTFFWGLSGEMSLLLVGLAFYPGAFIGVFIAKQLISRLDKKKFHVIWKCYVDHFYNHSNINEIIWNA